MAEGVTVPSVPPNLNDPEEKQSWRTASEAAEKFSSLFYRSLDKPGRSDLPGFYTENAILLWNGNRVESRQEVVAYWTKLPRSQTTLHTLSAQPIQKISWKRSSAQSARMQIYLLYLGYSIFADEGWRVKLTVSALPSSTQQVVDEAISGGSSLVMVNVFGSIKFDGNPSKTFSETFFLIQDNSLWRVQSDTFRFIE